MRGEEDRAACVAVLAHHALENVRGLRVKTDERFVHENELRLVQPCGDDRKLLLHAVGIGGDGLRQIVRQRKLRGPAADTFGTLVRAYAENVGDEIEILDAAHKVVKIGIVGDIGESALTRKRLGAHGMPGNENFTLVELLDARNGAQRRGFARAVVTDEAINFARGDVQREIVHGELIAEGLGKVFDFQHDSSPVLVSFYFLSGAAIYSPSAPASTFLPGTMAVRASRGTRCAMSSARHTSPSRWAASVSGMSFTPVTISVQSP